MLQESGVRVYVLIYNVIERAVDLDSDYAMQVLTALHPNISVSIMYMSAIVLPANAFLFDTKIMSVTRA